METSDRDIVRQKIVEVEQQIARLQKQQEEAKTILRSLKEPAGASALLLTNATICQPFRSSESSPG